MSIVLTTTAMADKTDVEIEIKSERVCNVLPLARFENGECHNRQ